MDIPKGWEAVFQKNDELLKRIFERIELSEEPVYPPKRCIFRALEYTPPQNVKVVMLGLDPYHQPRQAMGFAFAVTKRTTTPPSLRNILKELISEGYSVSDNQITRWIGRGILLLNAYLTVQKGKSKSYREWRNFTVDLLSLIVHHSPNCVFLLLGRDAQGFIPDLKKIGVDTKYIVTAAHPSPLSAHNGFFGSNCFRKCQKLIGGDFSWDV